MKKILLVEDHPGMRAGVKTVLELEYDMEVVGEADDAEKALKVAGEMEPNLVVMDLQLKGNASGIEACREIKSLPLAPYVLVYTAYNSEREILSCRLSGADSYVHKREDLASLVQAIRSTCQGKRVWLEGDESDVDGTSARATLDTKGLTSREMEVHALIVRGFSNPQIAEELCISLQTVKNHVSSILRKLEVERRIDLI